jgi:hypothetical protein
MGWYRVVLKETNAVLEPNASLLVLLLSGKTTATPKDIVPLM